MPREDQPREMFIRQRTLNGSPCPGCGAKLDACTGASSSPEGTIPTAGQLTACAYCGALLEFAVGGLIAAAASRLGELSPFERRLLEGTIKKPLRVIEPWRR